MQLFTHLLSSYLQGMGDFFSALPWEGTEKVPFFYDQNGKCLRFVTSLSANRLNKAKIDR